MKQWTSIIKLVVLICDMTYFDTIPNYHATGHVVTWMVMWSVKWACDHIIIWNNDLVSWSWSFWYATWHVLKQFQIIMWLVMCHVNGPVISHMDMWSYYYYMKQCTSVIKLDVLLCNMTCFEVIPNYHVNGHVVMWLF